MLIIWNNNWCNDVSDVKPQTHVCCFIEMKSFFIQSQSFICSKAKCFNPNWISMWTFSRSSVSDFQFSFFSEHLRKACFTWKQFHGELFNRILLNTLRRSLLFCRFSYAENWELVKSLENVNKHGFF